MPHLGLLLDDAIYFSSAKSLALGVGYRILSLPGEPPQTKYPPAYPWILSWVWRLDGRFPENLSWAMLLGWLSLAGLCWLARRCLEDLGLGMKSALVLAMALAVNPYTVFYAASTMSETAFGLVLLGSLIAAHSAARRASALLAIVAGVLCGACYLFRTTSFLLLPVGALWFLWRRQKRNAAVFVVAMLPAMIAWQLWTAVNRKLPLDDQWTYFVDYVSYYRMNFSWGELLAVMRLNFQILTVSIGRLVWFDLGDSLLSLYGKSLIAVTVVGGTWRLSRRASSDCSRPMPPPT